MPVPAVCSVCHFSWTGTRASHCTLCHRTYSVDSNGDRCHRLIDGVYTCLDPESVGLVLNARGHWSTPITDNQRERLALLRQKQKAAT